MSKGWQKVPAAHMHSIRMFLPPENSQNFFPKGVSDIGSKNTFHLTVDTSDSEFPNLVSKIRETLCVVHEQHKQDVGQLSRKSVSLSCCYDVTFWVESEFDVRKSVTHRDFAVTNAGFYCSRGGRETVL